MSFLPFCFYCLPAIGDIGKSRTDEQHYPCEALCISFAIMASGDRD